jgi:hypothetical protein
MTASTEFPSAGRSPQRDAKYNGGIAKFATDCYNSYVSQATEDLMQFISTIREKDAICVMYFDEADELKDLFRVILRLLNDQKASSKLWCIFATTKSSVSVFFPVPHDSTPSLFYCTSRTDTKTGSSLKLSSEMEVLIPPFISLGFDQHMIAEREQAKRVTIGELQSLGHCCKYGRPL